MNCFFVDRPMSAQVKQSIKDIIPTLPEPIPSQLISHVDSLYKLSLLKLPVLSNNSEIGRYQICAFFAVDKLRHKLELPEPLVDKIPIAPRHLNKIFDDFRENVLGLERLNTPKGSPRKAPRGPGMGMSPGRSLPLTPTRQRSVVGDGDMSNTPRISSPLKRLQELQGEVTTPKGGNFRRLALAILNHRLIQRNPRLVPVLWGPYQAAL